MSTNLWLKLPHRLLHQPTWLRLAPRMKALAIQIALVAADQDCEADGGLLPELEDLAVLLRVEAEELETDLSALEEVGYLERKGGRYVASEFMRWQAVETPAAKRMRKFRAKRNYRREAGSVTVTSRERCTVTTTEPEPEPEPKPDRRPDGRPRARDPLFDAIAEICRVDPATTGPSIGKVRGALLKASPAYTPDEVRRFGDWWWGDKKMRQRPPTLWQLQEQIGVVRSPDVAKAAPREPHELPDKIPVYPKSGYQVVKEEE